MNRPAFPVLLSAFLVTAGIIFLLVPKLGLTDKYNAHFADGYDLIANNLASGHGYRWDAGMGETMIREPIYPLFLAVVIKIAGYRIEAARFANWLLTIGIVLMIMRLARLVTDDCRTALVAALLFLFHPGTLLAVSRAGVEILFAFVACAFMLVLYSAVRHGRPRRYVLAGLVLGLLVQVRSTPLLFPAAFLLYLAITTKSAPERVRAALNTCAMVLGMAIVMTPWIIRNYALVHKFVPTATVQGLAIQEGQYTCRNSGSGKEFDELQREAGQERNALAAQLGIRSGREYYQVFTQPGDEWTLNHALFQRAAREYFDHPALFARCAGMNGVNFWVRGKTRQITWLNVVLQLPLLALALGGLCVLRKRGALHRMSAMLIFVVCIVAVHAAVIAAARYSIPVLAFLVIPASVSLLAISPKRAREVDRTAELRLKTELGQQSPL